MVETLGANSNARLGDYVRINGTCREHTEPGAPLIDPALVRLVVTKPDRTSATRTAVRESEGKYFVDLIASMPGAWHFHWKAKPGVIAETSFSVSPSPFA